MTLLTGTAGNDSYTGTSSADDTAVINSNRAAANFSFDGTRWTVTSSAGSDTLSSVESVKFLDGTVDLVAGYGAARVDTNNGQYSSIARLTDGGWVVTWQQADSSGSGIYMLRLNDAGESVGAATLVNTTTTNSQTQPSAAGLTGGGYVVAWLTYDGSYRAVFQRHDAAGNKLGGETSVDSAAQSLSNLEVAGTANGGFAMTWRDPADSTLRAQLYDSGGATVGAELTLATDASADRVQIVARGGGYVAVWQQDAAAGSDIFQQRVSSTGEKIGSAVKVGHSDNSEPLPVVGALKDGSYVVAWVGVSGGEDALLVQRFTSSGAKVGTAFAVEGAESGYYYGIAPTVTGLEDGGFVVVWQGAFNGSSGVHLQRFDSSGSPSGTVQRVGATSYYDNDPDVVSLADGGFAVSWAYSSSSVYTQRFNVDGVAAMSEISATSGNDVLNFTAGTAIKLMGMAGNDSLTGGSGADLLDGGAGTDTMNGGAGNDTYVWQAGDVIVEGTYGGTDTVKTSVSYTLASRYLENAVLTGSAKGDLVGNGGANRLTGNAADNVLNGGSGADTLLGGAGSDTYVVDDAGDVTVESAGAGVDMVVSSVTTVLADNIEHLRLGGGAAIGGYGNASDNLITGNAYANTLYGAGGADTLIGGLGDDTYVVTAAAMDEYREYNGEGRDTIVIDRNWVLKSGLDSIENLTLREGGAFSGTGDGIANVIYGNSQANRIDGKAGADTMDGGGGDDTYIVDNTRDIAAESDGAGGTDLVKSSVSHTLGAYIENLTLLTTANLKGTGNDQSNVITGNAGANQIDGLYGADVLLGGAGNDRLTSADGMDRMFGGTGNDMYIVASEADEIVEYSAEGTDTVVASVARAYTLNDNVEKLTLVGAHIDGHGNTLANTIVGTWGNNLLDGGTGADTLSGRGGNDVYLVDNVGDVVIETAVGRNEVDEVLAKVSWKLSSNVENLTLDGNAAINGTGNTQDNRLIGNDAGNTLSGGDGADLLMGYGGADQLIGGTGADTMKGGLGSDTYTVVNTGDLVVEAANSGTDTVKASFNYTLGANLERLVLTGTAAINGTGNALNNKITGNSAANVLNGGSGADNLSGGSGADVLIGGAGKDTLAGGSGNDRFDFNALSETGITSATRDVISDFVRGQDKIDLSTIDANTATTANDAFKGTLIASNASFTAAGQLKLVSGVLYGNTDADATAEFAIQLSGVTALSAADFVL